MRCEQCGKFVAKDVLECVECGECDIISFEVELSDRGKRFEEDETPCGVEHALPCGLDMDCPVPVKHFIPNLRSETIYNRWREDVEQN